VQPLVLPARFPNLLVNGSSGIAVGMATNIPPHNLGEVIDACMALIDDPAISIDDLINIVPGPDFPTGGIILGKAGIRSAYHTGRGSIVMRGKVAFETIRKEREAIIVSEIPYQVNKATMVERIAELVRDKKIDGIADLRDESDRSGYRVVVELAGVDSETLRIFADDRALVVAGARSPAWRGRFFHMEIEHGPFQRRVQFAEQVDPANASATYERGLLTVTMPIAEREPAPEQVSIKIGMSA